MRDRRHGLRIQTASGSTIVMPEAASSGTWYATSVEVSNFVFVVWLQPAARKDAANKSARDLRFIAIRRGNLCLWTGELQVSGDFHKNCRDRMLCDPCSFLWKYLRKELSYAISKVFIGTVVVEALCFYASSANNV